jgi:hypothetical protein
MGIRIFASIFKVQTDAEGETKITFLVPSNQLAQAVQLNAMLQRELILDVNRPEEAPHEKQDETVS